MGGCSPLLVLLELKFVWLRDEDDVIVFEGFEDAMGVAVRSLDVVVGDFDKIVLSPYGD